MIQEIPDKVCKKCGGTTWSTQVYIDKRFNSNKSRVRFRCRSCMLKTRKVYRKKMYKPIIRNPHSFHKANLLKPCSKCGGLDFKLFNTKLRLDGTMGHRKVCTACYKSKYTKYNRKSLTKEKTLRRSEAQRKRRLANPEKWNEQKKLDAIRMQENRKSLKDTYIRFLIGKSIGIKPSQIKLSKELYEQFKHSLLIHRQIHPLKLKK